MPTTPELVAWARNHANELEKDMILTTPSSPARKAFWRASGKGVEHKIQARAISALDFLDRYAAGSQWAVMGPQVFRTPGATMPTNARALGNVLRAWADQVEEGLVTVRQAEALGTRAVASTDLMEQVRALNEDRSVHPAAPIVLAGAALEIALRAAIEEIGLALPDKHSISSYSGFLRTAGWSAVRLPSWPSTSI